MLRHRLRDDQGVSQGTSALIAVLRGPIRHDEHLFAAMAHSAAWLWFAALPGNELGDGELASEVFIHRLIVDSGFPLCQ
jgi:hypothetical protein